jgi:hypothetical protein
MFSIHGAFLHLGDMTSMLWLARHHELIQNNDSFPQGSHVILDSDGKAYNCENCQ